jgi:hypothetical protein
MSLILRRQIHYFSGELCNGMGIVASRFVEKAVFGISASGSVQLTEIGRALEEKIPLHAAHKRLSRNLADVRLENNIIKIRGIFLLDIVFVFDRIEQKHKYP